MINRGRFRSLFSGFSGVVLLFILTHFSHHLIGGLLNPLMPSIRTEFKLDYTQSGFLLAAFGLANGLGNLPAGWLADRIGPKPLITVGISGVALAGLLMGLSPNYVMMIVFTILLGIAGSGYHVSAPPLISESVAPNKRGSALGMHMIGGSGSLFLAPLIAVAIASTGSWRTSYLSLSIPVVILGIISYILLGRLAKGKDAEEEINLAENSPETKRTKWRPLIAFMTLSIITGSVAFSAQAFIPLYFVDNFGTSQETAAIYLSIIFGAGIIAGPLGGYLSDRFGAVPVMLVASFAMGPLIYMLNIASFGVAIGAVLVGMGVMSTVRMPVSESYIVGNTSRRYRSTILGVYYFSGSEISGVLTPVVGNFIDRYGFQSTFTIVGAVVLGTSVICSLFLWSSNR